MYLRAEQILKFRFFARELVLKELKLKFVGSYLGAVWLVLEPLLLVMSLSAIFTLMDRAGYLPKSSVPFPLFFYAGVLPWTFFAGSLANGPFTFLSSAAFLSKASFPREILVLKYLGVALTELACSSLAFLVLMFWYGTKVTTAWLYLPLFLAIMVTLAAGIVFGLGSLNVAIRDTATVSRAFVAILFWFTPVVIRFDPDSAMRILFFVNPMTGIIEGLRTILLFGEAPHWIHILPSAGISIVIFGVGYAVFRKSERGFVDAL